MKYKKLTGIVLKKQNYKEADQILTLWTREAGKVRCLAKSLRASKSKLAYSVQDLCLVEVELAGRSNLMTLIGAKPLRQFQHLRADLPKTILGFYAAELMLKITADEHPNEIAFDLLIEFLSEVDAQALGLDNYAALDNFILKLTAELGFGAPRQTGSHRDISEFVQDLIERSLHTEKLLTELSFNY